MSVSLKNFLKATLYNTESGKGSVMMKFLKAARNKKTLYYCGKNKRDDDEMIKNFEVALLEPDFFL